MGGKFKFQVQDSDLEYLFWRFDKYIALSEKKTLDNIRLLFWVSTYLLLLVLDISLEFRFHF